MPQEKSDNITPKSNTNNSFFPRIAAASLGSIVTAIAVTPLEVVKVRQQTQVQSLSKIAATCPDHGATVIINNGFMECIVSKSCFSSGCATSAVKYPMRDASLGTFSTLRNIFRQEGVRGIYAGLTPTLIMSVPNTVLYFSAYDEISSRLRSSSYSASSTTTSSSTTWNNTVVPLISGSIARILATTVTSPFELIRTRQASSSSSTPSYLWQDMKHIIQKEGGGITSLYKGLLPTLWRDAPFSAIYWLCLEHFQIMLKDFYLSSAIRTNHSEHTNGNTILPPYISLCNTFIAGATSGMIAATFTTPFDVIKTRQQTNTLSNNNTRGISHENKGTLPHLRYILETEGFSNGLMRGNTTRVIKVAPACAIMISCYEFGKNVLSQ